MAQAVAAEFRSTTKFSPQALFSPARDAGLPRTSDATDGRALPGTVTSVKAGTAVCVTGDPAESVYKVSSGVLRMVSMTPDGRRQVLRFLLAGDYFGFSDKDDYSATVEAVSGATLIRYSRQSFRSFVESSGTGARLFYTLACGEFARAQERMDMLARKSAVERLAIFLLRLSESATCRNGVPEVHLPMNRTDVADYLGLTIETVSRCFTLLKAQKVIRLAGAAVVQVVDPDALEDVAGDI